MQNDQTGSSSTNNHLQRYFHYAESILSSYKGLEPFHKYLKKYFAANKKHGSRDRKLISSLCYNFFRLGNGVIEQLDFQRKIMLSIFLCKKNSSPILQKFVPGWDNLIHLPLGDKLEVVHKQFNPGKIFSMPAELSDRIDFQQFSFSFLLQPKVFIRIRPGFIEEVIDKINKAGFFYEKQGEHCIAFTNNESLDATIEMNREAVIQDYNSQQTLNILRGHIDPEKNLSIWDCCAGSGGKSILAHDMFRNAKLTVSDKRKTILENLKLRFKKASIKNYELMLCDLDKTVIIEDKQFDVILADVPCSGSGTWSRTPEQLSFFNEKEIVKYAALQKKIVENALPYLKSDGRLLYITCSVFKKENEDNVLFIQNALQLKLVGMHYLEGYEINADTLFVALFTRA